MESADLKILVLAGDVIGLVTAVRLQQAFQSARITILTDEADSKRSYSGIFFPALHSGGANRCRTETWLKESWNFFENLRRSESGKQHGIFQLPCYQLDSKVGGGNSRDWKLLSGVCDVVRPCTGKELGLFRPKGKWTSGHYFHTNAVDQDVFVPYLEDLFESRGGVVERGQIDDLGLLKQSGYDFVINCSVEAGRTLFNDPALTSTATRKQVKVKANWIKLGIFCDDDLQVVPGVDFVTIGGGDGRPSPGSGLLEEAVEVLPNLAKAAIVVEERCITWVHRADVRLEAEAVDATSSSLSSSSKVNVVHHYGHGPDGLVLAPGSALAVVELVKAMI